MTHSAFRLCRYPIVSTAICLTLVGSAVRAEFEFEGRPWLGKQAVYSTRGIVSTMNPLASQAGIDIMKRGGNAFDAGIAAALVLSAVEGWMGGPGGSSYYLVYRPQDGEVVALDAGNLAPAAARAEDFTREMLSEGVTSMSIPGTMAGYWMVRRALRPTQLRGSRRARPHLPGGRFPDDAGRAGHHKHPVRPLPGTFPNFARVFAPSGHFPGVGGVMKNPELARTYRRIAAEGIDVFYKGGHRQGDGRLRACAGRPVERRRPRLLRGGATSAASYELSRLRRVRLPAADVVHHMDADLENPGSAGPAIDGAEQHGVYPPFHRGTETGTRRCLSERVGSRVCESSARGPAVGRLRRGSAPPRGSGARRLRAGALRRSGRVVERSRCRETAAAAAGAATQADRRHSPGGLDFTPHRRRCGGQLLHLYAHPRQHFRRARRAGHDGGVGQQLDGLVRSG